MTTNIGGRVRRVPSARAELRRGGRVAYLLGVPVSGDGDNVVVFEVDRSEVSEDLVLASPVSSTKAGTSSKARQCRSARLGTVLHGGFRWRATWQGLPS